MDDVLFVTSMSEEGRKQYGQKMLDSWEEHVPYFRLKVYKDEDLDQNELKKIDEREKVFHENLVMLNPSYKYQMGRFARKVFAITDPMLEMETKKWLIWIDADTIVKKRIDDKFIHDILGDAETCVAAYLGRKNWSHSECGFVAYNFDEGGMFFLRDFRALYINNIVYKLKEWHDSYVFDWLRNAYERSGFKFFDLSYGLDLGNVQDHGNEALNIWKYSKLEDYIVHLKGNAKYV